MPNKVESLFRLGDRFAHYDEVIGVTDKLKPLGMKLPIKVSKDNVCQQRGDDPTFVGFRTPSSMTPDLRNFSMRPRMFPSAISAAIRSIMSLWEMVSKKDLISASNTTL